MEVLYRLKEEHIAMLRAEYGPVVKREVPEMEKPVFVVGDASANFLLNQGVRPQIVVYDRKVERRRVPEEMEVAINEFDVREVEVENPKSTITRALVEAIREGLKRRLKIKVKGEDDLAALAIIGVAEKGTVVYGMPHQGMAVVDVEKAKGELKKILEGIEFQKES